MMTGAWGTDSNEPLYVRLKQTLRTVLATELKPGDRLPSEGELERTYGVSRTTVRLALGALADEGLVSRQQGRGSFVTEPKKPLDATGAFVEDLTNSGRELDSQVISFETMSPDERVARALQISATDAVYKIRRVWLLEGKPFCYQVSYVPKAILPGVTRKSLESDPAFRSLRGIFDGSATTVEESVDALLADKYRAGILGIPVRSALLALERVVYIQTGKPGEYNRSFYAGKAVKLNLIPHRKLTLVSVEAKALPAG
jgi:GntR family transcriptional regulator